MRPACWPGTGASGFQASRAPLEVPGHACSYGTIAHRDSGPRRILSAAFLSVSARPKLRARACMSSPGSFGRAPDAGHPGVPYGVMIGSAARCSQVKLNRTIVTESTGRVSEELVKKGVLAGALIFGGALLLGFGLAPGPLSSTAEPVAVTSTTYPSVPAIAEARPAENVSEVVPAPSEDPEQHSRTELIPISVMIPRIGVTSDLVDLGLNPDRTIEVPSDYDTAGWYQHRAVPGEPGPGVILGHVDSYTGPAVFFQLSTLVPGDTVDVNRSDGSVARFAVSSVEQHGKGTDVFPTERVYGWTDDATLRLITCGGDFDRSSRSYADNVVVFADLIQIIPPERVIG